MLSTVSSQTQSFNRVKYLYKSKIHLFTLHDLTSNRGLGGNMEAFEILSNHPIALGGTEIEMLNSQGFI